jgi:hypothetical protein
VIRQPAHNFVLYNVVPAIVCAVFPRAATAAILAGMRPQPQLTDFARLKLQVISFFCAVLLMFALLIQLLWNYLRRDFTRLPRLSYPKALGITVLWGLLFIIVLAMIAGARELMTPGAWERRPDGGYKLAGAPPAEGSEAERRAHLQTLRDHLWQFARGHAGQFPAHDFVPEIPGSAWQTPHSSRLRYIYLPGRRADGPGRIVAYEPGVFGEHRFTLYEDGRTELKPLTEIQDAMILEGLTGTSKTPGAQPASQGAQ